MVTEGKKAIILVIILLVINMTGRASGLLKELSDILVRPCQGCP